MCLVDQAGLEILSNGGGAANSRMSSSQSDAKGMIVSPGFIDLHSQGDGNLREDPRMESLVGQGITTIVAGQDGSSRSEARGQRPESRGNRRFRRDARGCPKPLERR
jgi:N-acyl-D-aspartate/D-glutamate deacylase